jgi:hypothetical protein
MQPTQGEIKGHVVVRDKDGNIKFEFDLGTPKEGQKDGSNTPDTQRPQRDR